MLKRKLWRDIKSNYGAYLACISVMVIGLMLYVSLSLTLDNLNTSQKDYYHKYKFAEGFAQVVKAPQTVVEDLGELPGMQAVEGRLVKDVLVYKPAGTETTTLRLVSFRANQSLNLFKLERGHVPTERGKEILVSPAFLTGNHYQVGDRIDLIIQGRRINFTIAGTANSPEYIYEIPNGQTMAPDPKSFGIAYIPYSVFAPLVGLDNQVNDLVFTWQSDKEFADLKQAISRQLAPYGLMKLYPRKDQLSHSMVTQEIAGLKASASTTPIIFLLVAASILYIMLRRMVEQQRGQIGLLKAFGFSRWQILGHYLSYALLIGFVGGLGGGLLGTWMSFFFAKLYQQYFNIPNLTGRISYGYLVVGTLLAMAFSLLAGFQGCRQVLALDPAEAMRPPAPKLAKRTLLERINWLWHLLNTQAKMAFRNIFRNKQRSILAILGIAAAFSMMVASRSLFDASYYLVFFQFDQVEKYDLKINLNHYVDQVAGVNDSLHLLGVTQAEPILEVPVTLSHQWLEKDVAITGLPRHAQLYRLVTKTNQQVNLPTDGLVVSTQLAKLMHLQVGDVVEIKPFVGDRKKQRVIVKEIIPQYVGLGAYMEINQLSKVLRTQPAASAILLRVEPDQRSAVRSELQKGKNVLGIQDKTKLKAQFEELMASSDASQYILLFFAFITGFAIIYNVNVIALSERERELATLMVLGMTQGEIRRILLMEQGFQGLVAILLGVPLSYGMLYAITNAAGNDIYNLPLVVKPLSYLIGLLGTGLFLMVAQWKIKGKVSRLSMLDVLKEHE